MMEAQCALAKTAIHGAEPGLAEVRNYFTCLENRKTNHNAINQFLTNPRIGKCSVHKLCLVQSAR